MRLNKLRNQNNQQTIMHHLSSHQMPSIRYLMPVSWSTLPDPLDIHIKGIPSQQATALRQCCLIWSIANAIVQTRAAPRTFCSLPLHVSPIYDKQQSIHQSLPIHYVIAFSEVILLLQQSFCQYLEEIQGVLQSLRTPRSLGLERNANAAANLQGPR